MNYTLPKCTTCRKSFDPQLLTYGICDSCSTPVESKKYYCGLVIMDRVVEVVNKTDEPIATKLIKSGWNNSFFEIIEYGDMDEFNCTLIGKDEMMKKYSVSPEDFEDHDIPCCCGACNR
jgi:hypothetical protein